MLYMPESTHIFNHLTISIVQGLSTRDINQNPKTLRSPNEHNIPFKEVRIKTKDNETLHGWFLYQSNSYLSKTIVYFHENAGSK